MTQTLLLLAALSSPPSAELLALHRANVRNWTQHTPAEERAWRELWGKKGKESVK